MPLAKMCHTKLKNFENLEKFLLTKYFISYCDTKKNILWISVKYCNKIKKKKKKKNPTVNLIKLNIPIKFSNTHCFL